MSDPAGSTTSAPLMKTVTAPRVGDKGHRVAKRRAPKACQCCRARKVRCNVTESGAPCMNCRLDEVDCVVTESKRKRRCLPKGEDDNCESSTSKYTKQTQDQSSKPVANKAGRTIPPSLTPICRVGTAKPGEHVPHSLYQTISERLVAHNQAATAPQWQVHRSSTDVGTSVWPASATNPALLANLKPSLPAMEPFLKPIPPRMTMDELMFLQRKMVVSVPAAPLRNEVLRAYIDYVHPLMPILELDDFLRTVENADGGNGKVSLLLFHAVLFAASLHVDEKSFVQAGFSSKNEARSSFFTKARALYDMDYETDRLVQVQALLLLSSWHDKPDERKDGSYWTGLAITTAYAIGLDREPGRLSIDPQQQRHCKRLWWCLVMRELMLSLELRRLPRVRVEDCEAPLLDMDDFNLNTPLAKSVPKKSLLSTASDVKRRRFVASACIQRLRLCLCIAHVLKLQLSPRMPRTPRGSIYEMDSPTSRADESTSAESYLDKVSQCRTQLHEWYQGLPEELQLDGASSTETQAKTDPSMALPRLCLHMIHFAALSVLHISKMSQGQLMPSTESEWHDIFQQVVQLSSLRLAEVARTLLHLNLVQHLPPNMVAVLFRSATVHLQMIHSMTDGKRSNHLQSFVHCVRALYRLQGNYPSAEQSLTLIETAARRASPRIPAYGNTEQKKGSSVMQLICEAVRNNLVTATPSPQTVTPPPEDGEPSSATNVDFDTPYAIDDDDHCHHTQTGPVHTFSTLTPPSSRGSVGSMMECPPPPPLLGGEDEETLDMEDDFESFVDIENVFDEFTHLNHGVELKYEQHTPNEEDFTDAVGLMDADMNMVGFDAYVM